MSGKVYLVGAGPGDYKLMTLKGLECIRQADVIIYDRLVNVNYLKEAKETCECIYVGKASSDHTLSQYEINQLIIKKAQIGKTVTRLKGGDPYVFGRGGEEGGDLAKQGISFEVVPGITSAIGGLSYAGIPITHRDHASSFHVITGHLRADGQEAKDLNWQTLAQLDGTLVFLMGVKNLKQISENLIKAGKASHTPVALISWATTPNQKVLVSTLEEVYETAIKEVVKPPTLIVVGSVVNLREKLNFFEHKPLFGQRIMVTRARNQNSKMVEKITDFGGDAIEVPTIKIERILPNQPLEIEINQLKSYQYLILSSANAVQIFFDQLDELGYDSRALAHLKICVIGAQTAQLLKEKGIKADIVPPVHRLESLVEVLQPLIKPTDHILIPKAQETRDILVNKLTGSCHLKEIPIYRTIVDTSQKENLLHQIDSKTINYLTFSSASTVTNFVKLLGIENLDKLEKIKLISIGPITTQAMKTLNLTPYQEAPTASVNEMIQTMIRDSRGE